ncbi:MAG: methyltransferase domain-containing protein [Alphaproteobacteria bacterium]
MTARKASIAAAFGLAAPDYAAAAVVQREVAGRLARRLLALPLPPAPEVLEIGCGTGFLARAVLAERPVASWLATDIAPAMVAHCRAALGADARLLFACMDGEAPAVGEGRFDLVCSSMAFQWFEDLGGSLARLAGLLRPGGRLAFATLAVDTFREWREAHASLGLAPPMPPYPDAAAMAALWPAGGRGEIAEERIVQHHADARAFLATVRQVGAHTVPGRRPATPGELRRVLRRFGGGGEVAVTWHVVYGLFTREGP